MKLRNVFLEKTSFTFQNNIFYQQNSDRCREFENIYLALREKENRIFSDEIVRELPGIPRNHELRNEWKMRNFTLQKLINYLQKKDHPRILEMGCGNGWLAHHLSRLPGSEVVGLDVNEKELLQAARVFKEIKNLFFVYTDILNTELPNSAFDHIIFSASFQYFKDTSTVLSRLFSLLSAHGEIHIVDSPLYDESDVQPAILRSRKYFSNAGFPSMAEHYHHHTWTELEPFHPTIRYNPRSLMNSFKNKFRIISPFPWISITP